MNNDKYTFLRQHFTSDKKSGNGVVDNVCPECGKKTVKYYSSNENYPFGCAACGYSGNVYTLGYKNPIEQFNHNDKESQIAKYREQSGKYHRLKEPAWSMFNMHVKELFTTKNNPYHSICIIRDNKPVKILRRNHNTNKYGWELPPYKIYGEPKSIWLFDDLVIHNKDEKGHKLKTVYIVAGENDAQAFFNKTGIIPVSPINGEKSRVSKADQVEFCSDVEVVILFDNDKQGRKGSNPLAYDISKYVKTKGIKIVPADKYILGGGSDLDDYFQAGGTWENLQQVIENTPAYVPPAPSIAVDDVLDCPPDANYDDKIKAAIKKNYKYRYNEITNQIEIIDLKEGGSFINICDRDENEIQITCRKYDELKRLNKTDLSMILNSKFVPKFNPFLEYFENLDLSDETDYIKQVCDYITVDNDCQSHKNEYIKMWLVGLVAQLFPRIPKEQTWEYIENKYHIYEKYDQTGKNQYCLILQGEQGKRKTEFFEWFANVFGHQYFYNGNIDPDKKDHIEHTSTMAIVHLDELADKIKDKKTLESYKSLIAGAQTVNIRKAYGRHNTTMFRHASFCASINDATDLLNDLSGARRWMILTGIKINRDVYKLPIDKLMAQLFKLYINGFQNWYDDHDIMNKRNEEYRVNSIEEQLLLTALGEGKFRNGDEYMTAAQIGTLLLEKNPKYSKLNNFTLGKICTRNLPDKKRIHRIWHYNVRKPKDDENKQSEIKVDDPKQEQIKENKEFEIDGIPF